MLSRRGFIAGLGALAAPAAGWASAGDPVALSGAKLSDGSFALVGLRLDGGLAFSAPLPARGHAGAAHPAVAEAVVVARRPGRFAMVVDCARGAVRQELTAPQGRHFYGHAAFSEDGSLLLTPENEYATGAGRIGIWDRRLGYRRIDEVSSGGIGPHEIIRLKGDTFTVANGGIRTHPKTGRERLNLDDMEPNLTILDATGSIAHQVPSNAARNSVRHIAADEGGRVVVGCQWQGDPFDAPALVAIYAAGRLTDLDMDPGHARGLAAYIGSVCAHGQGAAVSAPRGGRVEVLGPDGGLVVSARARDICGLCSVAGRTIATDGLGRVYRLEDGGLSRLAKHPVAFDNHLIAL